jgi:hypothetical protein
VHEDTIYGLRRRFPGWVFYLDGETQRLFAIFDGADGRLVFHGATCKELREKLEDEGW